MIENAAFVADLNPAQPPAGDKVKQGYAQLNLIKGCLVATFPNANAPITATVAHLNNPLLATERPPVPENFDEQVQTVPYYTSNNTAGTMVAGAFGKTVLAMANAAALSATLDLDKYFTNAGGTMTGHLNVPSITIANAVTIRAESGNPVFAFTGGKIVFDVAAQTYNFYIGEKNYTTLAASGLTVRANIIRGVSA